jgi:hypothetical protein
MNPPKSEATIGSSSIVPDFRCTEGKNDLHCQNWKYEIGSLIRKVQRLSGGLEELNENKGLTGLKIEVRIKGMQETQARVVDGLVD